MGDFARFSNKALLPINKKAILSHILDHFPKDTDFVIGLGFLGQQVRDFLAAAHGDRHFTFVDVAPWEGEGSGPGTSLLCCRSHLNRPFHFVSCDTLWEPCHYDESGDWAACASVPREDSVRYCNMRVQHQEVVEILDKAQVAGTDWMAFTGWCHIQNHAVFWKNLVSATEVAGERQISGGLQGLFEQGSLGAMAIEWTDVGTLAQYRAAVTRHENFDFGKEDEFLYIQDQRVIKFFANAEVSEKRVQKARLNHKAFPTTTEPIGGFYSYEFVDGSTLYQRNSTALFSSLLEWLESVLWKPVDLPRGEMESLCNEFYRAKTLARLEKYRRKYPQREREDCINGVVVPKLSDLISRVAWEPLLSGVPVFFHGDLQFDNILHTPDNRFLLLDWRQDFGGRVELGDQYYDLAKLCGGIILNYDYIKSNLLTYEEVEGSIEFDFAQRHQRDSLLEVLEGWVTSRGLEWGRVEILVPLIYLNMSPLHHYPFDKLLHALGRLMLSRALDRQPRYDAGAVGNQVSHS